MTDRVGRASAIMAAGTIVSRGFGFVRAIALAGTIGLIGSASADAFAVANQLPSTIYAIVAGGVLSAILVPHIVRASASSTDGGAAYINKLLTVSIVLLAAATFVATAAAPLLTLLYGTRLDADTLALATAFAWWCLPQIFFYGLYSLLGEVLNSKRKFGPYTWAPVLNNVVALLGMLAMVLLYGSDPEGTRAASDWTPDMIALLGGTATLGIAAQALILGMFWRRMGLRFRLDFRWRGVGLDQAGKMAGWTFGMLLASTFAGIIQTNVVGIASGVEGAASVAALGNAWLVFMLPHSIVTVSIATAYFTRMSEHAGRNELSAVKTDLSAAARLIGVIIVFATAAIAVVAYPIGAVFAPGQPDGVFSFGNVVLAYILGLLPFSLLFVVQRTFYAMGNTKIPFLYTLVQVALFSVGAIALSGLPPTQLAFGLALLTSAVGTVQLLVAIWWLRRHIGALPVADVARALGRAGIAILPAVLLGIAVAGWLGAFDSTALSFALESRIGAIVSAAVIAAVMLVVYVSVLRALRAPELAELRSR